MAYTGKLGTINSLPGNIELGIADAGNPLEQSVSSVLSFVSTAVANNVYEEVESAITFVSTATAVKVHPESVSSPITFAQSLVTEYGEDVESAITFVSTATAVLHANKSVSSPMTLVQDHHVNIVNASASNALAFTQAVNVAGPIYYGTGSQLNLTQEVIGNYPQERAIVHFLGLSQVAGIDREEDVTTTISFVSTGFRQFPVTSAIAFVQTATHAKGVDEIEHTLDLEQDADPTLILNRSLSSPVSFNSSVTYILERSCTEQNYTPFVGSGGSITPPSTTVPTLGNATLTLTYPYTTPTTTLVLRNPEFQNQDSLNFNRINRETRGGTLVVYADPNWPKAQSLTLTVSHLKQTQVDDLLDFLLESLGKEIGLLDHENRQWRGIILTPDAEVSHVGRENRSVQFEFEGELV